MMSEGHQILIFKPVYFIITSKWQIIMFKSVIMTLCLCQSGMKLRFVTIGIAFALFIANAVMNRSQQRKLIKTLNL